VNTADGTFLQDHAPDPAAAAPEPVSLNPYLVWDILSDSPQAYQAPTAQAALEGTHTIDGQEYKTVFTLVKENHAEYSIDWAAETTGIDASRIADLAMQYALKGPSCLTYGMGGVDKFYNAETLGHAMAVAAGLTGNIGKPGGSMGLFSGYANEWYATLGGWPLPEEMNPSPAIDNFVDLPYQENKVHAILTFGDKLFQWFANMNEARKWWTSLDFILYCDIYHSESADWADIILPACTKFEELEEIGGLRQAFGYYRLQEKVLDPLFDSKPDFWIEREIAKLWHLEDHLPATPADYVRAQLTNPTESFLEGVTLEKIRANQNVLPFPNCEGVRVAFEDHVFSTGSGRLEVYYPSLLSFGRQLPKWEPANEAYAGNELKNTYPIQLHGSRPKYYIHNQFHDAKWIQQYKEACVEMNPADLETRGLMPGDIVEIFNDRGTCSTKVVANSSIRPGSASIVEGTWSKFMDSGNMQALTNSARNPVGYATWMGPVTPFNDTLCEVRKAGTQS
ncbi:MAG: molybdopterin-dependent oxidoreductase, partial [Coriobacteriales bacterium]|jgi:molybdopterin-containing oxidoreductase family molybdopterin binding subunit|nr:molybdopterin-dependent oxidoreductase [Coriobacteriales bacterium]